MINGSTDVICGRDNRLVGRGTGKIRAVLNTDDEC